MPRPTLWFLRTSLLYFAVGLLLGGVLQLDLWLGFGLWVGSLRTIHGHFLLVGWVTQMIFGVAYWMFPRVPGERPRGSHRLAYTIYALLNAGLLLRAITEPSYAWTGVWWWGALMGLSGLLQVAAGLLFVYLVWSRVRAPSPPGLSR